MPGVLAIPGTVSSVPATRRYAPGNGAGLAVRSPLDDCIRQVVEDGERRDLFNSRDRVELFFFGPERAEHHRAFPHLQVPAEPFIAGEPNTTLFRLFDAALAAHGYRLARIVRNMGKNGDRDVQYGWDLIALPVETQSARITPLAPAEDKREAAHEIYLVGLQGMTSRKDGGTLLRGFLSFPAESATACFARSDSCFNVTIHIGTDARISDQEIDALLMREGRQIIPCYSENGELKYLRVRSREAVEAVITLLQARLQRPQPVEPFRIQVEDRVSRPLKHSFWNRPGEWQEPAPVRGI